MLVSVLMITYNHEAYILEAINGILNQEAAFEIELIVSNDASSDNSHQIILDFINTYEGQATIAYHFHENNLGIQENFKFAHSKAKGKYIAICEGDDYWIDSKKLQKQVDFLEQNLDYSLSYTRFKTFNQTTKEYTLDFNSKYFQNNEPKIEYDFPTSLKGWHIGNQTLVFRAANFDHSVYTRYKKYKDVHVVTHLLNNGRGICLNFVGAIYRVHDTGIHSSVTKYDGYRIGYETHGEIYFNNKTNKYLKKKYFLAFQNFININVQEGYLYKAFLLSLKLFFKQMSVIALLRNFKRIVKKGLKI